MGSSAASIFIDNKLIAAVEEERITRVKNDGSFPAASIKECLRITGLTLDQVDVICIYWKPYKVTSRFLATVKKSLSSPDAVKALYSLVSRHFIKSETDDKYPEATGKWSELFNVRSVIEKKVGPYKGKIEFFDHHLTHQLYGEAIRNWDKSLTLSYDGGGEEYSTVVSVRKGNHTETIKNIKWPNSLGHFYSYFTGYLGFKMQEGEYKMMGLAPYGKPIFKKVILDEILRLKPNGDYDYN
jgi:carbamoyltransferase